MRPEDRPVPPHVAANVLYYFGDAEGYPAGSFTMGLIQLMAHADPTNMARLTNSFPEYGHAVRLAQSTDSGMAVLREILTSSKG